MDKLELLNYDGVRCDTGINLEDVEAVFVVVLTGDEIATVCLKDGSYQTFDSAELSNDPRRHDYFDGEYGVHKDDLDEWMKRENSYYWFGRMQEDARV